MSRDILRLPSDDFARSLNPKGMFVRMEEGKERKSVEVRGQSQRQGSEKARLLIGHSGEPTHQQRFHRGALSIIYFNPNICTLTFQGIRGQIQAAIGKALNHGGSYKYAIKFPSPRLLVVGHSGWPCSGFCELQISPRPLQKPDSSSVSIVANLVASGADPSCSHYSS
jgi:hypothetical protein